MLLKSTGVTSPWSFEGLMFFYFQSYLLLVCSVVDNGYKKQTKKKFPHRESNPGRLGENQKCCQLHHGGELGIF